MLSYVKYKLELWKLDREERQLRKPFDKEWKATKDKSHDKYREVYHHIDFDLEEIKERRSAVHTSRLMSQMFYLDIPVPPPTSHEFTNSIHTDSFILTQNGRNEMRKRIRAEQAQRRQPIYMAITLVTGLLGAATGLAAVLIGK